MKQKILYFSHVQWDWIKQRPQFIAEELNKKYNVTVVCRKGYSTNDTKNDTNIIIKSFFRLPFERFGIISKINLLIARFQAKKIINKYDIIWLTYPDQYKYVKGLCNSKTIIYDCMDDMLEFITDPLKKEKLRLIESKLIKTASINFCSSEYLKNKLCKRYGDNEIFVINNAIKDDIAEKRLPLTENLASLFNAHKDKKIITYIGTISEWIDTELIVKIVERHNDVIVFLFGPLRMELQKHKRIIYCGSVNHDVILSIMESSDLLIMPFILNELILSVNPVKLYEYIYSGTPCLAPRYGESEPFMPFVSLYNNHDECMELINKYLGGQINVLDKSACVEYAMNNTWKHRVETMFSIMSTRI